MHDGLESYQILESYCQAQGQHEMSNVPKTTTTKTKLDPRLDSYFLSVSMIVGLKRM